MASSVRALIAVGLAVLAASLTASTTGHAQTAADRETARALMDDGFARRDKGDHAGALEHFLAADTLMHVPTTGIEVARERALLGQLIEAREAATAVQRFPAKPGEPAPFAEARAQAQKLDEELGARIPSLRIVLRGSDPGATVAVDGVDVPTLTLLVPRKLNPGTHTIIAKSGGKERTEQAGLKERESKELVIDFAAPPPAPPPPVPQPAPVAPPRSPATPAAPPPEATHDEDKGASKKSPLPQILVFGGFGLAGLGAIVGTVAGISSLSSVSSAKNGCTPDNKCPPATYSDIDAAKTAGTVSTIGFVAAGVGAAAGVVGLVLWKRAPAEGSRSAHVEPWIGPGSAGLRGAF
jgi:hypothetical protein